MPDMAQHIRHTNHSGISRPDKTRRVASGVAPDAATADETRSSRRSSAARLSPWQAKIVVIHRRDFSIFVLHLGERKRTYRSAPAGWYGARHQLDPRFGSGLLADPVALSTATPPAGISAPGECDDFSLMSDAVGIPSRRR